MISQEKILEAARVLHETAKPAKVILFGSYARGEATEDSDVDFMVIEPAVENRVKETLRLRKAIRPLKLANDLLVYSRADVEKKEDWCSTAIYWALKEGKVLYDTLPEE